MRRQFHLTHTVRYDECDCYGFLTPAAFLRYMQDIAGRDAEDARLEGNGFWVVRRTIISFFRPVALHTRLELRTYGLGFTRITAQRGYDAYIVNNTTSNSASEGGEQRDEPVIRARTLWVYIDTRGRPARLPEGTAQIWLPDGPQAPQPDAPLPTAPAYEPEIVNAVVRFSETDFMHHMNNAASVELLDNVAWDIYANAGITPDTAQLIPSQYDIEYVESPLFGEHLEIQSWFEPVPSAEQVVGQEFDKLQQITRTGRVVIRASSHWKWSARE